MTELILYQCDNCGKNHEDPSDISECYDCGNDLCTHCDSRFNVLDEVCESCKFMRESEED